MKTQTKYECDYMIPEDERYYYHASPFWKSLKGNFGDKMLFRLKTDCGFWDNEKHILNKNYFVLYHSDADLIYIQDYVEKFLKGSITAISDRTGMTYHVRTACNDRFIFVKHEELAHFKTYGMCGRRIDKLFISKECSIEYIDMLLPHITYPPRIYDCINIF